MNHARKRTALSPIRHRWASWRAELAALHVKERAEQKDIDVSFPERTALQYRKWSLIHKVLREHPFHVSERLPRYEQWARVRDYIVQGITEPEIVDWLNQQIDITRHIAQGIPDLRPRKNGPCHSVLTEWVANRESKALAVHRWALAASAAGVPLYAKHVHPTGQDEEKQNNTLGEAKSYRR